MFIREMAAQTGLSEDTLRYYERIGILPAVPRNGHGVRQYSTYHIEYIGLIQSLKGSGMSLEDIQQYMSLAREGAATEQTRRNMLVRARQHLLQQRARIEAAVAEAEFQLAHYETSLLVRTNSVAMPPAAV
ncbi:MerR family transcriptional regulator [uncultured Megasphaera sp.]|uniref:MerR family transcriptional regulator n=1 Tax=uncultured Megasphaera sp. TaxID=165188 RepID=UPI002658FF5E|nr:MerR family transcriptional regulator [uncultured Megasphaera sp.]